jgi:hypothetical protein
MSKQVQVLILQGLAGKQTWIKGKQYPMDEAQAKTWESKGLCKIIQTKRRSKAKTNKED